MGDADSAFLARAKEKTAGREKDIGVVNAKDLKRRSGQPRQFEGPVLQRCGLTVAAACSFRKDEEIAAFRQVVLQTFHLAQHQAGKAAFAA